MGSIKAAMDQALPGTAVMVKAGTYVERVDITHGGQDDLPIWLISADGKGAAQIESSSSEGGTIWGFGVANLVIRGSKYMLRMVAMAQESSSVEPGSRSTQIPPGTSSSRTTSSTMGAMMASKFTRPTTSTSSATRCSIPAMTTSTSSPSTTR